MTIYWPFFGPLIVICAMASLISILTSNWPLLRVAVVLALNWLVNTVFCFLTGVYDPWQFFFVTDALSAMAILLPPAGRVQAVIGYTYIGQLLVHVLYGLARQPGTEHLYWAVLTEVGFVQLALLGGWTGGYGGHRVWSLLRPHLSRLKSRFGMA